jgi:coenzyme F420-dependent glucose-6-phosphate dehydrogenase
MTTIGFHASHELYSPGTLLRLIQRAEQAGFRSGMCSDHFHPWIPRHGESGFSFAWLGAALQATALPIGTVCCPAFRHHPAIVAQASATLAEMFPDRFWLALGTGQALNEHITGSPWPDKNERRARVREAAQIIRSLWAGEEVSRSGKVRIEKARLYTRPERSPLLFGAAITEETARWVGSWADGLLTVGADPAGLRKVIDAFRSGGGGDKPLYLQSAVAYDPDEDHAWKSACERWPQAVLTQDQLQNVETPEEFAALTSRVTRSDLEGRLRVSSDLKQHVAWIQEDMAIGFDGIFLHNIGGGPEEFIDVFGSTVLPACRS